MIYPGNEQVHQAQMKNTTINKIYPGIDLKPKNVLIK